MSDLIQAYILAKNESCNVGRCVASLVTAGVPTMVLDSGSTDGTQDIAAAGGAEVRDFVYINHCESYNRILEWHTSDHAVLILDADMQVTETLVQEVKTAFSVQRELEAAISPVDMYWDGSPLRYSSLYPPKPIAFRCGRPLFKPTGHGEQLIPGAVTVSLAAHLVHDDRKPLEMVLANQVRYARDTVRRAQAGNLRFKDRLRLRTPIYMLGLPFFSYFVRGGFRDGRTGVIYALDRLIAEALTLRTSLANRRSS